MVLDVEAAKFELCVGQLGLRDIHSTREARGVALAFYLDQPFAKAVLLIQGLQLSFVGIQLDIVKCGVRHYFFPRTPQGGARCRE